MYISKSGKTNLQHRTLGHLPFRVVMTGGAMTGGWSGSVLGLGANDMGMFPLWKVIELFAHNVCTFMYVCYILIKLSTIIRERIQNGLPKFTSAYKT